MQLPVSIISALFLVCACLPEMSKAQSLYYKFDETGATAANRGSEGDAYALTLYETGGVAGDIHSAKGTGELGGEDRALDLSSSTQMGGIEGEPGSGPVAGSGMAGALFNSASSFTLAGWYKANSKPGNRARLMTVAGKMAIRLMMNGYLAIQVGNDSAASNTKAGTDGMTGMNVIRTEGKILDYTTVDQWVFFAVTYRYDESANEVTVTFYQKRGDRSNHLEYYTVHYTPTTPKAVDCAKFFVGGDERVNIRPFQGLLDEVYVYVSAGTEGALSREAVERLSGE